MAGWFRKRRQAGPLGPPKADGNPDRSSPAAPVAEGGNLSRRSDGAPPEQPIPLTPFAPTRRVRPGEVLPAVGDRSRLALPALLRAPKRTLFAAGMVAGLAAPMIVRHVVLRSLWELVAPGHGRRGQFRAAEAASVEIIRVTGVTARHGHAAELVGRVLERALP